MAWKEFGKKRPCPICGGSSRCCRTDGPTPGKKGTWPDGTVHCFVTGEGGTAASSGGMNITGYRMINPGGQPYGEGDYIFVPDDGASASVRTLGPIELARIKAEEELAEQRKIDTAKRLWGQGTPKHADIRQYIARRGIALVDLGETPQSLRLVAKTKAYLGEVNKEHEGPAILCACVRADPRSVVGLQRIFLGPDGGKADLGGAAAKRSMGVMAGAACRLFKPAEGGTLVIAEGVETALAIAAACRVGHGSGVGVWAAISANGVRQLQLPGELFGRPGPLSRVVIAVDRDKRNEQGNAAGPDASADLAKRLRADCPWLTVTLAMPGSDHVPEVFGEGGCTIKGLDWLDVYVRAGAEVVREAILGKGSMTYLERAAAEQRSEPASAERTLYTIGAGAAGGADIADVMPDGALPRARRLLMDWPMYHPTGEREGQRWHRVRFGGQWYSWEKRRGGGYAYVRKTDEDLTTETQQLLQRYQVMKKQGDTYGPAPMNPGPKTTTEVVQALASECIVRVEPDVSVPCWAPTTFDAAGQPVWGDLGARGTAEDQGMWRADSVIAFADALVDVEAWARGELIMRPHTPRWFSEQVLPYAFPAEAVDRIEAAPEAERPAVWMAEVERLAPCFSRWLNSVAPAEDANWGNCLGGMFALCLTADVSHERIFLLIGPPGSGKSSAFEAVTSMIGEEAVCAASLGDFADDRGLTKMVGKRAVILHDASLSKVDAAAAMEGLKKLSGGDMLTVRRLYSEAQQVRIAAQILISYNEPATLPDNSGALARRQVVIPFSQSFVGKADPSIKAGIRGEGTGIALYALYHLRRLRTSGSPWAMSEHGQEMADDLRRQQSHVLDFLEDSRFGFVREPDSWVATDEVYTEYMRWCNHTKIDEKKMLARNIFGRKLLVAAPSVRRVQRNTINSERVPAYLGLARRPAEFTIGYGAQPEQQGDGVPVF
jgi:energy-coupling factor transporter ATP-binding protein EcfA2